MKNSNHVQKKMKLIYFALFFGLLFTSFQLQAQGTSTIQNRWKSTFISHLSNSLNLGTPTSINSKNWLIEPVTGTSFVRIKNTLNNTYLHVQNGPLELGSVEPGWWSAMWTMEPAVKGYMRIKNRWRSNYIHNQNGKLEVGAIENGWWSAMWKISKPTKSKMVAFAHMVNNKAAVKMSMEAGANGVELDLQFNSNGKPTEFRHGGVCDCSCKCPLTGKRCPKEDVCNALWSEGKSHCNAKEDAATLLKYLADNYKNQLAVVYIDSKVDEDTRNITTAGREVIKLVDANLFARGYRGQVVIGTPYAAQISYASAAVGAANLSPNKSKYYFAIDGEGTKFTTAMNGVLSLPTKNRTYSVGITVCAPQEYQDQIKLAAINESNGVLSAPGVWTLDKSDSMKEYINAGASSIISNKPSLMVKTIRSAGRTLAKPGEALRPSFSDVLITSLK